MPRAAPASPSKGSALLRQIAVRHRKFLIPLAALSFVSALQEAAFLAVVTSLAINLAMEAQTLNPVMGVSLSRETALTVASALLVARFALSIVIVAMSTRLAMRVAAGQRDDLAHAYLEADWSVQQTEPSGQLQLLTTSFVTWSYIAISSITLAIGALLSIVAFLSVSLLIDPVLTGFAVFVVIGLGSALRPIRRRIRERSQATVRTSLEFGRSVSELGALGLEMHTYGVRQQFAQRISKSSALELEARRRSSALSGLLPQIYTTLVYAAVLGGIGGLTAATGRVDVAAIGAVILLVIRSLSYGQSLQAAFGRLAEAAPYLDRMVTAVKRYEVRAGGTGDRIPEEITPVRLREVSFEYAPNRSALHSVSLQIERGEMLGVIGPSGAGKSTLAEVLLGLRFPTAGSVEVGDIRLDHVDREFWSTKVAFVAQSAMLVTGTVRENIRFFRPSISDADIERAAHDASVHSDVMRLEHGFDTHLGERGAQLSGGQRQRLSIARALAGAPEIIVLDEPTSALDGRSEALVRDALNKLRGEVTIVLIAHRMSTLNMCDRVVVIEDGHVTTCGTPHQVYEESDFYRRSLEAAGLGRGSEAPAQPQPGKGTV